MLGRENLRRFTRPERGPLPCARPARRRQTSICRRAGLDDQRRGYQSPRGQKQEAPPPVPLPGGASSRSRPGANRVVVSEAINASSRTADNKGMTDTMVYMLSNETTGLESTHDSLNAALDAVNDNVANGDRWIVQESGQSRPLRFHWVAEGRGHSRVDDDRPRRDRRTR